MVKVVVRALFFNIHTFRICWLHFSLSPSVFVAAAELLIAFCFYYIVAAIHFFLLQLLLLLTARFPDGDT